MSQISPLPPGEGPPVLRQGEGECRSAPAGQKTGNERRLTTALTLAEYRLSLSRRERGELAPLGAGTPTKRASPMIFKLFALVALLAAPLAAQPTTRPTVRIVLAGHTHVVSTGTLSGIPVWTGGAVTFLLDGLPPGGGGRGLVAPAVSRIDLFADDILASSVPFAAPVSFAASASAIEADIAELRSELPVG